jgi:hypothetical protein
MDDMMLFDRSVQAQASQAIAYHDDMLREIAFDTLVKPNMTRLRGGNDRKWNEAGWYSPIGGTELVTTPSDPFPVPDGCWNWYPAEYDAQRGGWYRFFVRHAWLELSPPDDAGLLSFVVAHVVMGEVLGTLRLSVNGIQIAHAAQACAHACAKISVQLSQDMIDNARRTGHLRLDLYAPIEAMPALIYEAAQDYRHLSMAICFPYFEGGVPPAK